MLLNTPYYTLIWSALILKKNDVYVKAAYLNAGLIDEDLFGIYFMPFF